MASTCCTITQEGYMDPIQFIIASSCLCLLGLWLKRVGTRPLPFPPGPKGLPIIGHALDIPSFMPWKTFREWSAMYGKNTCLISCFTPYCSLITCCQGTSYL